MRLHKGKKWIYISFSFYVRNVHLYAMTAFAQNTILTVTVPSEFLLKIEIDGKGEIQLGKELFRNNGNIR